VTDRSIVVRLRAEISDFKRKMSEASDSAKTAAKGTSEFVSKHEQSINTLSNGLGLAGAGLTAFAGLAVTKFASFDAAMSSVQAATMETAGNMDRLREAAIQAGADTQYSATEAAGAIEELAKAGVSTQDILGGGLRGAMDLAASGAIDVGQAAEIAASAMTQFSLGGEDVTHIADLLAAGAGKAQGGVDDLGMALNQAGLVASQTGLSIEEAVGGLTAFAAAGLTGSDAGTSFKTMLQSLTPSSKEAAELMDQLGISAYDSSGEFIGLAEFAGVLQGALKGMSVEQQNAAMKTIFGADAVRAASVLFKEGEAGIREWTAAVDDQGFAAEQAAIRMDNLKGDLEGLGGSFETAMIRMGESANSPLRWIVQQADAAVDALASMPAPAQAALMAIVGGGGLALLGAAAMGKLVVGVNDAVTAMRDLGIISETARARVGRVGAALGKTVGFTAGLYGLAMAMDAVTNSADKTAAGVEKTTSALLKLDGSNVDSLFKGLGQDYEDMAGAMDLLLDGGFDGKMERFGSGLNKMLFGGQLADQVKDAEEQFEAIGDALAQMVNEGNGEQAARIFDELAKAGQANGYSVEQLMKLFPPYEEALAGVANQSSQAAAGADQLTAGLDSVDPAAQAASEALSDWLVETQGIFQSFIDLGGAYQGAIDKNREMAESSAAASKDSSDSWEDFYDGVSVSASDYITQLGQQVAAQEAWATNMTDLSTRVNSTMTGDMRDAANGMIDELLKLGPEGAAQVQLLHDMSDEELAKVVELYQRKGAASGLEFAEEINKTRPNPIPVTADGWPARREGQSARDYIAELKANISVGATFAWSASQMDGVISNMQMHANSRRIMVGTTSVTAMATGGEVTGGVPGQDSVPTLLMPQEHVWTTAEVRAAGGHQAMYRMRAAALRGELVGLAEGGPPRPAFANDAAVGHVGLLAATQSPPAGSWTAPGQSQLRIEGMQLVGTMTVNGMDARMEAVAVGVVESRDRSAANTRTTRGRRF
jgi:TP901 family phage tail tape measure protein